MNQCALVCKCRATYGGLVLVEVGLDGGFLVFWNTKEIGEATSG